MGTQPPSQTKGAEPPPQFSTHFYCGQTAGCIKMPLGMEVGLITGNFVFDEDPAPSPKVGAERPIFGPCLLRPNGCMDQDATWYGGRARPTRHCVQRVLGYPQKNRAHPPHLIFGPCLLWPNGWMDEDAAGYGIRPRPRPQCTRWGPSSRERGTAAPPPIFGPCLLWPRSPISATAELLLCVK